MIKKSIQCTTEPLENLITNGEEIDFRLNEPQWADLQIGDIIEYWEDFSGWDTKPDPNARRIKCQIIDMVREKSFINLMHRQDLATFFKDDDKDEIIASLRQWWTAEKEKTTGVLGLRVKLISSCD